MNRKLTAVRTVVPVNYFSTKSICYEVMKTIALEVYLISGKNTRVHEILFELKEIFFQTASVCRM